MKKVTLTLAAMSLVALYAGTASAQCAFDVPVKSKGVKGSMVRAYAPCPSTETPIANTQTEGGTEACTPVTPRQVEGQGTLYSYGPEGTCAVQTQAKLVKDCSKVKDSSGGSVGLQPGPCHVTFVKGKCKNILGIDGTTPIGPEPTNWSLATLSRATLDDNTNGDMTVIDFPVTFAFDDAKDGSLKLKGNSAAALAPLVGPNNADLPTCTSIEIVDVTIKDPGGLPFARLGGATLPD